jgi:O-antigen ligase
MQHQATARRGSLKWVAAVCGLADSSVWVAFLLVIPTDAYYGAAIAAKIALALIQGSIFSSHRTFFLFLGPALLCAGMSILTGLSDWASLLQVVPFAVSLSLTLALIDERSCRNYFAAFSYSGLGAIVVFIGYWATGRLESEWGRWTFLGEAQPNLGGEIFFAGALAAAISARLRSFYFLGYILLALFAAYLLQARSAMVAIFTIGLIALNYVLAKRTSMIARLALLGITVATIATVVELFSTDGLSGTVSHILLFDDQYRGFGTGFVNRNERWELAWSTFSSHPLFGVGFGNELVVGDAAPHSFWLYMISEMGAMSLISLFALLQAGRTLLRKNAFAFSFFCSALILTIFNDRFINMNAYPFLLYVMLFLKDGAWTMYSPAQAGRAYPRTSLAASG